MRTLTLLLFCFASQLFYLRPASARFDRRYTPHLNAYTRPTPSRDLDVITSRQYHERRQLIDVCAHIDTPDILGGSVLGIPLSDILDLNLCLCLSAFPLVLELDVQLKVLTDKYGASLVQAALELLINTSPGSRHCTYPAHSEQVCSADDPCGFTCDKPYVKQGNKCVCALPNTMCNGVCGDFSSGCGSAAPRSLVGRADGVSYGRLTGLLKARASCKNHETVCGVPNGEQSAYDCVDTNNDLESCGGCIVPSPFYGGDTTVTGRDCSAIEGVYAVSCVHGGCSVISCNDGWMVNSSGDGCSPIRSPEAGPALNVAAKTVQYSALNVRSHPIERPDPVKPEPKVDVPGLPGPNVGGTEAPGPKEDGPEMHAGYYANAWFI